MLICSLVDFQTFANLSALFIQNIVAMIGKILETPWLPIQRKKYVMATQFASLKIG
jgi:endonuclease IV